MVRRSSNPAFVYARHCRAFSLAELLVVVGVIALLIAITLPPLQYARRQAMRTQCSAQLQQLGRALGSLHSETGYFPKYDDAGAPIRYTWIDVLIQQRLIGPGNGVGGGTPQPGSRSLQDSPRLAYCPADLMPDSLNTARNGDLTYPLAAGVRGVDYSYGIGVPLSSGGWALRAGQTNPNENRTRRFRDHERNMSGRVLAGDAYDSKIYNLSGNALLTGIWNLPTQFDNTVAWGRHAAAASETATASNLLFQDCHVATARFDLSRPNGQGVNTSLMFTWQPGEPVNVTPNDAIGDTLYPDQTPPSYQSSPPGDVFPNELLPYWYTQTHHWELINHK